MPEEKSKNNYIESDAFYAEVFEHLKYRESIISPYCQELDEYHNKMDNHLANLSQIKFDVSLDHFSNIRFPVFPKTKLEFDEEFQKAKKTFDKGFKKQLKAGKVEQSEYDERLFNKVLKFDFKKKRYIKTGKFLYDEKRYDKEAIILDEYYTAVIEYYMAAHDYDATPDFEAPTKPIVQWTNSLAIKFDMIVQGLATNWRFRQYTFIEEMKQDATLAIIAYGHNFNYETYDKPFSYYNLIAWQAFVQRIKKEAREQEKKYRYILHNYSIDDDLLLEDGGDGVEALNKMIEMFDEKQKDKEERTNDE